MIVSDANLVLALCVESEFSHAARAVWKRDSVWCAPVLWISEVRNALCTLVRTDQLKREVVMEVLRDVHSIVPKDRTFAITDAEVMDLALASKCSAYDCEYVALAYSLRIPLVTWDKQVLKAFRDVAAKPESFA